MYSANGFCLATAKKFSPLISTKTVTLHPLVVYYKNAQDEDAEEDLGCRSYITILDDR